MSGAFNRQGAFPHFVPANTLSIFRMILSAH